jgi:tRNA (guanine-N7-)-methyltransferase
MLDHAPALPIYESRRLPWPVLWTALFGREAPLLLEIGFGNGRFLVDLAATRPEANVLGLEISQPALRRAASKARARGLRNVCLVYGPAQQFLWSNCSPGSMEEVYINFPDPWPKASHHHRRLLNERFLDLLATRLRAGGTLDIATDHPDYAGVIAALLVASPYFESRHDSPRLSAETQRIRSKYEEKALAEGRACHYFYWRRNQVSASSAFAVPEEMPMPHAIVHCPLSLEAIAAAFESSSHTTEDHVVRFISLFRAQGTALLLVDTHVEEEPLAQRVGLTIRPRGAERASEGRGAIIVGVHELGFPRGTAGVQAAVIYLTRWLLSLYPDSHLVHSNLQFNLVL